MTIALRIGIAGDDSKGTTREMDKDKINADQLSKSLASTYLDEMMHMVGVISNPEGMFCASVHLCRSPFKCLKL